MQASVHRSRINENDPGMQQLPWALPGKPFRAFGTASEAPADPMKTGSDTTDVAYEERSQRRSHHYIPRGADCLSVVRSSLRLERQQSMHKRWKRHAARSQVSSEAQRANLLCDPAKHVLFPP